MGTVVDPAIVDYLTQAGRQAGKQTGRQADRQAGSGQVGKQVADR
jgi:hypothetical protein